jgi:hypothetical protein
VLQFSWLFPCRLVSEQTKVRLRRLFRNTMWAYSHFPAPGRLQDRVAPTGEFVEPDQTDLGCPVPFAKTFPFQLYPNQNYKRAILSHTEGRFAIVTNVGHGMRWTLMVLLTNST